MRNHRFFNKKSLVFLGSIEIQDEDDELVKVFFKVPSSVSLVWGCNVVQDSSTEILNSIRRDNPEDKLKDLQEKFQYYAAMINHQNNLLSWSEYLFGVTIGQKLFYSVKDSKQRLTYVLMILIVVQNILQLIYTKASF